MSHADDTRRWREANPEKVRENSRRWKAANPEKKLLSQRQWRSAVRAQVLAHYGPSCACCAAVDRLTVDHMDGRGGEHRKEIGEGSPAIHAWLIRNGFPGGFQILCYPCNRSKGNGDRCALDHERKGD